ncbi:hypothetical protein A8926_1619 [Saccharopolyspora spinosa]|uniref:Uncharacterized protein n=1 Tax=Saccharopolyspora spinosa TaxID=60894 RepID=A0A2N3XTT1_SACSN|nr:hypothetical protein A8926_1619 [Saccharopolyspora spinosa]
MPQVEVVRRLVEDEHPRLLRKRMRDRRSLPLAAGQRANVSLRSIQKSFASQGFFDDVLVRRLHPLQQAQVRQPALRHHFPNRPRCAALGFLRGGGQNPG